MPNPCWLQVDQGHFAQAGPSPRLHPRRPALTAPFASGRSGRAACSQPKEQRLKAEKDFYLSDLREISRALYRNGNASTVRFSN